MRMSPPLKSASLALLLLGLAAPAAFAQFTYNGSGGWDLTTSWTPSGVPGTGASTNANVVINRSAAGDVFMPFLPAVVLNNWNSDIAGGSAHTAYAFNSTANLTINGTLTKTGSGGLVIRSAGGNTFPVAINNLAFTAAGAGGIAFGGPGGEVLTSLSITNANVSSTSGENALIFLDADGAANYTVHNLTLGTGGALVLANGITDGSARFLNVGSLNGTGGVVRAANNASTGIATLNLTGTSNGTFSGSIVNGSATTRVVKTGAATQILSGANTYSGLTTVSQGTLQIGNNEAVANVGASSFTVDSGAKLAFNRNADNVTFTTQSIGGAGDVEFNGQSTGYFAFRDGSYIGALTNTGKTIVNYDAPVGGTQWYQRTLWLEKDNVFSSASVLDIQSGKVYLRRQTNTGMTMAGLTGAAGTVLTTDGAFGGVQKITINATSGNYTYAGIIGKDPGNAGSIDSMTLTKSGAGTQILSGANTYTGNTVINDGVLEFGSTSSQTFTIGGAGTNNAVSGPGSVFFRGAFSFNLAGASTNNGDSWTIVAPATTKAYDGGFSVTGFTNNSGVWTRGTNGVIYRFAQSNSILSVDTNAPVAGYPAWVGYWQTVFTNFTATATGDDPDGDGFNNGTEFAFDGVPMVGSPALLSAVKNGTNALLSWVQRNSGVTYTVKSTTNLATGGWSNAAVTVTNAADQNGINLTNDYTRRSFTVPGTNKLFFRVEAVVP